MTNQNTIATVSFIPNKQEGTILMFVQSKVMCEAMNEEINNSFVLDKGDLILKEVFSDEDIEALLESGMSITKSLDIRKVLWYDDCDYVVYEETKPQS